MTGYLAHHSHGPIVGSAVFERVQRELSRRQTVRTKKAGVSSPFADRLVCGDCGAFYGHRVWRNRGKVAARHGVWCCDRRYTNEKRCDTPILRENEITTAFAEVLKELGRSEREYTNALWYEQVEEVAIYEDRQTGFHLANGNTIHVNI